MLRSLLLSCAWFFVSYMVVGQNEIDIDSSLMHIQLDDVVVTAQYAPIAVENAVHQVKVIKAQQIRQEGQNNLAEVLTNQLNLRVSNDPILGNGLRIQGIGGENIQVMIDGVPVIGRVGGNIDLSQINLNNVQQIEIIEGAMSAQYGSNASGGVINIITKKSQPRPLKAEIQTQIEDIGIYNHSATLGMQLDKLYIGLIGMKNKSELAEVAALRLQEEVVLESGETVQQKVNPWNPKTQYGVDATLRYRFTDSMLLTYQYRFFDETLGNYGEVRRPQFRPYAFDEFYTTEREDHQLSFETYFGKKLYFNTTTAYNQYERLKETQRLDFESDTTQLVINGQDTTRFTTFLHRSILSTVSSSNLNGQLGLEILSETGEGQRIVDITSNPINQANLSNYALWGSLKYQLDRLTVQGNLRYGYNTKYDHPLIPAVHINWALSSNWKAQFSYASGFRAPSLKELHFNFIDINHYIVGNTDLKPETSHNSSLLISFEKEHRPKHRFSLSTKFFYNSIKDRIIIAEFAPLQFNYQNVEQFETHGANINFSYDWRGGLSIQSGMAFTRVFNTWSEEYATDRFTWLYETQNRFAFTLPKTDTRLILTHRFFDRQVRFYTDSEDVLQQGFIGAYQLFNATVSQQCWNNRIFLAIGSKNIFNVRTVSISGESNTVHSNLGGSQLLNWGRTFFFRLQLSL